MHCYPEPVTHKHRHKLSLNPKQQGTDGGQLVKLCVSTLEKKQKKTNKTPCGNTFISCRNEFSVTLFDCVEI